MNKVDRRCLSIGRWVATNLDTGATEVVVRFGILERRHRRDKFVKKHAKTCAALYRIDHWHKGVQCKRASDLVRKARRKLDYSDKTGAGDIFRFIMDSYREMFKPPPSPGCTCGYCKYHRK